MSDVRLSDQLGALAIVDELFQQKQIIEQYLDQTVLRAQVAEQIQQYYQAKGLAVDQSVIEQGVKLWFEQRLRFTLPKRSQLQKLLGNLYIQRRKWFKRLLYLLLAVVLLVGCYYFTQWTMRSTYADEIATNRQQVNASSKLLDNYLALSKQPVHYATVPVMQAQQKIAELLNNPQLKQYKVVQALPAEQLPTSAQIEQLKAYNQQFKQPFNQLNQAVNQLQQLLQLDSSLYNLLNDKQFQALMQIYPVLKLTADQQIAQLQTGEQIDLQQLQNLTAKAERAQRIMQQVQQQIDQLKALHVPQAEMQPVLAIQSALHQKLYHLDFTDVAQDAEILAYQQRLDYYLKLAQQPLELRVVQQRGSVYTVYLQPDNQPAQWFIVVHAVTPKGEIYPLQVNNIDNGQQQLASIFAQQVPKKTYEQVIAMVEKQAIKPLVGKKPKGRLTFDYQLPVLDGAKLEW